jgi:hypothetical protein
MKVLDLFEAKRAPTDKGYYTPGYDEDTKKVIGLVKDWMARIGATAEDIAAAMEQAKELPSFSQLKAYNKTTAREAKNGTFSFVKPHPVTYAGGRRGGEQYSVYANGQIRASAGNYQTKLKSPKPALVAGDAVKSLVKLYDNAFKELGKKMDDRKAKKAGEIKKIEVQFKGKDYYLTCEPSKFDDGFRAAITHKDGQTSFLSQKSFGTQDLAINHARKVFNGDLSGFKF